MNRHQKIKKAIEEILELQIVSSEAFFAQTLPQKLSVLQSLMFFPGVKKDDFLNFIRLFQNDIAIDIKVSLQVSGDKTAAENQALLDSIKKHTEGKLRVVEYACTFFLESKSILYNDEDKKSLPINSGTKTKSHSLFDRLFHSGKNQDSSSKPAAVS